MQLLAGVPLGQGHQTEEAERTWSRYHTPAREQHPSRPRLSSSLSNSLVLGKGILLPPTSSLPYPSQHEVTDVSDNGTLLPELLHGFTPGICGKKGEAEMPGVEPHC